MEVALVVFLIGCTLIIVSWVGLLYTVGVKWKRALKKLDELETHEGERYDTKTEAP